MVWPDVKVSEQESLTGNLNRKSLTDILPDAVVRTNAARSTTAQLVTLSLRESINIKKVAKLLTFSMISNVCLQLITDLRRY